MAVRRAKTEVQASLDATRSLWIRRQGILAPAGGSPADVVERTGWVRSLAGADPYLAILARCPGLTRADVDDSIDRGELKLIPAVRGCMYLVPASDAPDALSYAGELWRPRTERELEKAGSDFDEVGEAAEAVHAVLKQETLSTTALRKELPKEALRSFGDKGKKVGLSSPLPVALRQLEFEGKIERIVEGGRLDTESYLWRRPKKKARKGKGLPRLVERLMSFAAPLTTKEIATWIGASQTDVKKALDKLGAVSIEVEGRGPHWAMPSDVEALNEPLPKGVAFLPMEDLPLTVHDGPAALVDEEHHDLPIAEWSMNRKSTLGKVKHPCRRILVSGHRVVGFWEFDPESNGVVTGCFAKAPAHKKQAAAVAKFIRDEIGHGRSTRMDSDKALAARVAEIGKL